MRTRDVRPVPVPVLGWVFLWIGATAFGDTGPVLGMIERELVDRRRAITRDDITEALTYTKLLPGSTVVQIVAYLGYRLGGWPVSALVTTAFILPSALAMLLLAMFYVAVSSLPLVEPAVTGVTAGAIGILLATAYRLGTRNVTSPLTATIAVLAFAAGAFGGVNAAFIVIAAGLVGIPLLSAAAAAGEGVSG